MTDDTDTNPSSDALTPEEQSAFDAMQRDEAASEPAAAPATERAEPDKATEAPVEPDKTAEQEPEVQKLVPHGAFEEERRRRKEAQTKARELELTLARLQGQQEALKPADQQQPPAEIDIEKNPIEAIRQLKAERDAERLAAKQQAEAEAAIQGIIAEGQRHCQEFAKAQPLFFDGGKDENGGSRPGAYQFLREAAAAKLAERGVPAHLISREVDLQEIKIINDALQYGQDPAAAIWHWAQIAGFKPATAEPARNGNGQFAAKPPTEAARLSNLAKAEAASKSLGSAAGGAAPETGLEALFSMSDKEFAEATKGDKWERLWR